MSFVSPFGVYGFSEEPYFPFDSEAFDTFLSAASEARCWLLELTALSLAPSRSVGAEFGGAAFSELGFGESEEAAGGGETTFRYSTHGYATHEDDSPANVFYDPRIDRKGVVIDRQIVGRGTVGGLVQLFAEVSLVNDDGALDDLQSNYAMDGRRVRILIGRPTDPYSAFGVAFDGVLQSSTLDLRSMRMRLSDGSVRLLRKLVENSYAGTGDLEGGDDLKGQYKPRAFGSTLNVSPPLINATLLIYQVNDGAIQDVPMVYDRGAELTQAADYSSEADLLANAPSSGEYRVYKAGGYFRLGSTPDGTVTADVEGDASPAYVDTTADIMRRILSGTPALNSSEIDPASFARLDAEVPAEVGVWYGTGEMRTCADAINDLLIGIGAFGGFERTGAFTVNVFREPVGDIDARYTSEHIMDLQRLPLPAGIEPIAWRASVAWQRNFTLQDDLAASVPTARVSFVQVPERIAVVESSTLRSRYRLATEYGPVPALYAVEADAEEEVQRLFDLWATPRMLLEVRLPIAALVLTIGDLVHLTYSRFGLSAGRTGRVLGYRLEDAHVELKLLV
jgi:hypothetical protein